jgi:hypothetical protein
MPEEFVKERKMPQPRLILLAPLIILSFIELCQSRPIRSGQFADLVSVAMQKGYSGSDASFGYELLWRKKKIALRVNLYDSRRHSGDYDDNCVAVAKVSEITCDVSLVDKLIDELHLVTHWSYGGSLEQSLFQYRKNILTWIMAHELGHIILGDGLSDYMENPRSFRVFDAPQQAIELRADAFAIELVGNLKNASLDAYSVVMTISNSLLRKAVCPAEYPEVCSQMPRGVGLIYDYTELAEPIRISLQGDHPDALARFLRILYLAGKGAHEHPLSHEAKQAIDLLCVDTGVNDCVTLDAALSHK